MKTFRNGWVVKINNRYVMNKSKSNPLLLRNAKFFSNKLKLYNWLEKNNVKDYAILPAKISSLGNVTLGHKKFNEN